MVSVLLIIIETNRPMKESGPCSWNMSSSNPVEAAEETRRISVNGRASCGKPNLLVIGETNSARYSNAPEALSTPTAIVNIG